MKKCVLANSKKTLLTNGMPKKEALKVIKVFKHYYISICLYTLISCISANFLLIKSFHHYKENKTNI